jgi:hypothetical protein
VSKNQQLKEWRERLGLYVTDVVRDNDIVKDITLRRIESGKINLQYPSELIANVVNILEEYYTKRDQVKKFRKLKGVK